MSIPELTVERYAGTVDEQRILLLHGPLTMETSEEFDRAMREARAETTILDLTDVPYIDSVGLGLLVAAHISHQKTGRYVVLTGVKPRVQKVFEVTDVHKLFMIFDTTWQAVEAMAHTGSA